MESPHAPTQPTNNTTRRWASPWYVPLVTALIFALVLSIWSTMAHPSTAFAYQCTRYYSGACYATGSWGGANGSRTTMNIANITCSGCSTSNGWFVIDGMWLQDNSEWAINNCWSGACWVEVGTWSTADDNCGAGQLTCYYWADSRPCGGGYVNHFGQTAVYDIGTLETSTIQLGQDNGRHSCGPLGNDPPQYHMERVGDQQLLGFWP